MVDMNKTRYARQARAAFHLEARTNPTGSDALSRRLTAQLCSYDYGFVQQLWLPERLNTVMQALLKYDGLGPGSVDSWWHGWRAWHGWFGDACG